MSLAIVPDAPAPAERLLSAADVAQRLNVSRRLVYELIKRRDLAGLRIGGMVRVEAGELARYIEAARRAS